MGNTAEFHTFVRIRYTHFCRTETRIIISSHSRPTWSARFWCLSARHMYFLRIGSEDLRLCGRSLRAIKLLLVSLISALFTSFRRFWRMLELRTASRCDDTIPKAIGQANPSWSLAFLSLTYSTAVIGAQMRYSYPRQAPRKQIHRVFRHSPSGCTYGLVTAHDGCT